MISCSRVLGAHGRTNGLASGPDWAGSYTRYLTFKELFLNQGHGETWVCSDELRELRGLDWSFPQLHGGYTKVIQSHYFDTAVLCTYVGA